MWEHDSEEARELLGLDLHTIMILRAY